MSVQDTRMMARAIEQRWPINSNARKAVISQLLRIIANPASSPREVTAAAKALLAAESQNQSDEHKLIDVSVATRHDELDAIAADLGIEIGAIEAADRAATGGAIATQGDGRATATAPDQ
jgi:hypothetical protein